MFARLKNLLVTTSTTTTTGTPPTLDSINAVTDVDHGGPTAHDSAMAAKTTADATADVNADTAMAANAPGDTIVDDSPTPEPGAIPAATVASETLEAAHSETGHVKSSSAGEQEKSSDKLNTSLTPIATSASAPVSRVASISKKTGKTAASVSASVSGAAPTATLTLTERLALFTKSITTKTAVAPSAVSASPSIHRPLTSLPPLSTAPPEIGTTATTTPTGAATITSTAATATSTSTEENTSRLSLPSISFFTDTVKSYFPTSKTPSSSSSWLGSFSYTLPEPLGPFSKVGFKDYFPCRTSPGVPDPPAFRFYYPADILTHAASDNATAVPLSATGTASRPVDVPVSSAPKAKHSVSQSAPASPVRKFSSSPVKGSPSKGSPGKLPAVKGLTSAANPALPPATGLGEASAAPAGSATPAPGAGEPKLSSTKYSAMWLPDMRYVAGYADFIHWPRWLGMVLYMINGNIKVPLFEDAPVYKEEVKETKATKEDAAGKMDGKQKKGFPLIIFSHGLGGMRTTYSFMCYQLASYGYVVASIEHYDGSGSLAMAEGGRKLQPYLKMDPSTTDGGVDTGVRHAQLEQRKAEVYRVFDFLSRLNNGDETLAVWSIVDSAGNILSPPDDKNGDKSTTVQASEPTPAANRKAKLKEPGKYVLGKTQFQGTMDLNTVIIAGHSFGGATSVCVAQSQSYDHTTKDESISDDGRCKIPRFSAGLALDPWMIPIKPENRQRGLPPHIPFLFINSHKFHWPVNLEALRILVKATTRNIKRTFGDIKSSSSTSSNTNNGHNSSVSSSSATDDVNKLLPIVITIRDTAHQDQSDMPLILPKLVAKRIQLFGAMNPFEALHLNLRACVAFLKRVGCAGVVPAVKRQRGTASRASVSKATPVPSPASSLPKAALIPVSIATTALWTVSTGAATTRPFEADDLMTPGDHLNHQVTTMDTTTEASVEREWQREKERERREEEEHQDGRNSHPHRRPDAHSHELPMNAALPPDLGTVIDKETAALTANIDVDDLVGVGKDTDVESDAEIDQRGSVQEELEEDDDILHLDNSKRPPEIIWGPCLFGQDIGVTGTGTGTPVFGDETTCPGTPGSSSISLHGRHGGGGSTSTLNDTKNIEKEKELSMSLTTLVQQTADSVESSVGVVEVEEAVDQILGEMEPVEQEARAPC